MTSNRSQVNAYLYPLFAIYPFFAVAGGGLISFLGGVPREFGTVYHNKHGVLHCWQVIPNLVPQLLAFNGIKLPNGDAVCESREILVGNS